MSLKKMEDRSDIVINKVEKRDILIRQLPEGYKKSGFNVLYGYFIVLALLVAMIYIKYI